MQDENEKVVLVDEHDRETGLMEKLEAHRRGLLHRAFSVFVFDRGGRMLLQRRAREKYHSGGLLTNACCSHPRPGEATEAAAHRRLREEMGIDAPLEYKGAFTYRSQLSNGLTEHEFDHVYFATHDGDPKPDPLEADGFAWVDMQTLREMLRDQPEDFTPWFVIAMEKFFGATRTSTA